MQRAFDLFYGCPTIFCMYTVTYLYLCQEMGKGRLRINLEGKEAAFCERQEVMLIVRGS